MLPRPRFQPWSFEMPPEGLRLAAAFPNSTGQLRSYGKTRDGDKSPAIVRKPLCLRGRSSLQQYHNHCISQEICRVDCPIPSAHIKRSTLAPLPMCLMKWWRQSSVHRSLYSGQAKQPRIDRAVPPKTHLTIENAGHDPSIFEPVTRIRLS